MKTNYETPQIEVIETELKSVLCASGGGQQVSAPGFEDGEGAW